MNNISIDVDIDLDDYICELNAKSFVTWYKSYASDSDKLQVRTECGEMHEEEANKELEAMFPNANNPLNLIKIEFLQRLYCLPFEELQKIHNNYE